MGALRRSSCANKAKTKARLLSTALFYEDLLIGSQLERAALPDRRASRLFLGLRGRQQERNPVRQSHRIGGDFRRKPMVLVRRYRHRFSVCYLAQFTCQYRMHSSVSQRWCLPVLVVIAPTALR